MHCDCWKSESAEPKCNSTDSRKVKLCERVKRPFCPNLDLLDLGNWIFWTDGSDLLSLLTAGVGSGSHPQRWKPRQVLASTGWSGPSQGHAGVVLRIASGQIEEALHHALFASWVDCRFYSVECAHKGECSLRWFRANCDWWTGGGGVHIRSSVIVFVNFYL